MTRGLQYRTQLPSDTRGQSSPCFPQHVSKYTRTCTRTIPGPPRLLRLLCPPLGLRSSSTQASVQADLPAPPCSLVYYFEITVVDPGAKGSIGMGYAPSGHNTTRHVG
jgi:hypothetical protein